ncbi:MAG TPA: nucleotidyltransferase family protein [Terracidiphilus sp.]
MQVAAVILAAGASRRLGQPKQLLQLNGETLLARAVRIASEAGAEPVFAVLGAHAEEMQSALATSSARILLNAEWQSGLASSVRVGVLAVQQHPPAADGVLLMNCDQPRLNAAHLRALLAAFAAQAGQGIAASSYSGARGVPAIFPRALFGQLQQLTGDKGARALLMQSAQPVALVPFAGGDLDIDTPDDLAHLA